MKVIVIGGAGFIGSHIVDLLVKNNYEVCIIDNLSHSKLQNINSKARFYRYNILNKDILNIFQREEPDVVIHEAAQISTINSIENPIKDAETNIIGTINLLEAAKNVKVKKIIYASSAAVFGEPKYLPIDEKHSLNMISSYGVSKHTVEHYLSVYKNLYDISYVVLRYSNVYGPRQDSSGDGGVISIFCDKLLKNQPPLIYGDGEQRRDFIYVKDVAKANLLAVQSKEEGIFNVSSNKSISINQLLKYMCDIFNKNISPIYEGKKCGDIRESVMTYKKILKAMGWKPEYEISRGLEETIDFYKKVKNE